MANTGNGSGAEWHHAKIRDYFNRCFDEIYTPFLEVSDDLVTALTAFVNDDEHKGAEAEQSKLFVNDMQIGTVQDTIYDIQLLCGLMQGEGFEEGVPLLEKFLEEVDEDENTVIKSLQIEKVIKDFKEYSKGFKAIYPEVKSLRDEVVSVANGCDVISRSVWTDPDPKPSEDYFDAFVDLEGESGSIQVFYKKFCDFLETHNDDISGSNFKTILDGIVNNLNSIINGLGDGSFDITRYTETKDNIKWTNVKDLLDGDDLKKYLEYMKSYSLYLQGLIPRCQVYKYDPVNMSSGNYINDRTDLTVAGRHPLVFRRFYNAQSDLSGILGKGWTTGFDVKLRKNGDDDNLKAVYNDGHEGIYKKETIRDEEVYVEIHGEEGIVREVSDGHVLVRNDGSYEKYDAEGFLVATGDIRSNRDYNDASFEDMFNTCKDELTKISYENFDLNGKETVLPVKVTTGEGKYLSFSYNPDGTLKEVNDSTGRCLGYSYETRVQGDNKEHFLTAVTYPNGSTRRYEYNDQGLICSVTSPDGVVALTNEYDEKRRVIHQSFPDGGEMSYSYDEEEHITTATEQNGCVVEYLSDERGRHVGTRYKGVVPGSTTQDVTDTETVIEERFTYNERNQKTSVTDKNGHVTRYSYDNRGHLTGIVGPEGLHESYTYNADGRLISKKDSEGNQYKYAYDTEGNLYSVTDPEGNKTRYDYEDGKVVSIRDAAGNVTSLTYDENGNIKTITDKAGVTTTYECDSLGRALATIDALGNRTEYTLDSSDNITSVTDPLGNRTSYTYNSAGLVTQLTNPDGTTRTWAYNEIGRPAFYTDEEDRTTAVFYNKSWKEEKITLPNGGDILYTYDLLGNRIAVTDPEGRKTTYTHDGMGNVLSEGNTTYRYDSKNRVVSETDGEGNETTYTYDKNDNLICKRDALGGLTVNEYDSIGRIAKTTDPAGRITQYTYDANGNLLTTTDPAGVVTTNHYENDRLVKITQKAASAEETEDITLHSYEYDSLGRVVRQTERDGFTLEKAYDGAGRVIKVTGSNGRVITYSYDACGRIIETDDCGTKTFYTYTGTGKIKSVTDALGNETRYSYNELDLLSRIERFGDTTDGAGHVTIFEHDRSGRLVSEIDALGQQTLYAYDAMGNLQAQTDRDGYETIYTRDNNGNITGIQYGDGNTVRYKYNALNILEEVEDKLGLTKIESDGLGRTTAVTNPEGETVSYKYGPYDEKTQITYPDGTVAEYEYDKYGRLIKLTNGKETGVSEAVNYEYDSLGRLSKRSFPNGTESAYEYYQGGLLKSLTSSDRDGVLDRYEYTYNEKGNRTQISRSRRNLPNVSGTYAYSYDELGRLTGTSRNGVETAAYTYDAFGNRTSLTEEGRKTTYSYDVLDRLMSKTDEAQGTISYAYDRRGNIKTESDSDKILKSFSFDARGRLIGVRDDAKGSIEYDYDALGYRIGYTVNGSQIRELRDHTIVGDNLLQRHENGVTESYLYDGTFCAVIGNVENWYAFHDELGSTMYLTGTDGAAHSAFSYDDFGRRTSYKKENNVIYPFAFTGYQEDEISNLAYAQARYYSPDNGRFISEDICKGMNILPITLNPYLYCINDPKIYADKNGAIFHVIAGALVGAVTGAAVSVVHSCLTGEDIDWKAVGGAAIGGAVAGAVTAACPALGPAAIGAIGGGTTSLATGLLKGESLGQVAVETAIGTATGAIGGKIFQGLGATVGKGVTNLVSKTAGNFISKETSNLVGRMAGEAATSALGGATINTAFNAASHWLSGQKYSWKDARRDAGIGAVDGIAGWAAYRASSALFNGAANAIEKTEFGKTVNDMVNKVGTKIGSAFRSFSNLIPRMGSAAPIECTENANSLEGYTKDARGRWHRPNGDYASNAEVGLKSPDDHYLHRPYIRKNIINEVNEVTIVDNETGMIYDEISDLWVDPNNVELGHTTGNEFTYWRDWAESQGMTQAEFNDFMNNSEFYRWQEIHSNRSHVHEAIH